MKRWAIVVGVLYALMLLLLTLPLVLAGGLHYKAEEGWANTYGLEDVANLFQHWGYWLFLAVMLAGQAALLLVPVAAAEGRPIRRRPLRAPIVASTFFLANLSLAGLTALLCAALPGDKGLDWMFAPAKASESILSQWPPLARLLDALGLGAGSGFAPWTLLLGYVVLLWMIWGLLFHRYGQAGPADAAVRRLVSWLLRGSILELLVAVPCHVVVRQRGDCCAPTATFWGISLGLSVMLMAFGPGVFFLFLERAGRLRPRGPAGE
ncbi:MAG: hypothetical protein RJA22_1878 [Verrucomicrobiota bacterium]|jgi:hypothetical protein